jgi:ribonuclease HII
LLSFERQYWDAGLERVAGIDEAGRGPLAGPVVAAAVVLAPGFADREEHGLLAGIDDSKKLTAARREHFHDLLMTSRDVQVGVGQADAAEIDEVNILRATHLAMRRAIASLPVAPQFALVDGRSVPGLPCRSEAIVGGDARSLSVAAASIVAKVVRDRLMKQLDAVYPVYGFGAHKGYGTSAHMQALLEHGPCPIHRRSFRPVREAAGIRERVRERDAQGTAGRP